MNGYLISIGDRPGLAASLFEAAAARGVSIFPAYGLADGTTGLMLVGSDDDAGLRGAIADAGLTATTLDLVVTEVENRPGTGAEIFRKLAAAGINLKAAVPIGMGGDKVQIALGATDAAALRAALEG
jgi:hypothetical protein